MNDTETPPTYRTTCGTRWGLSQHAQNGEQPCGTCLEADDLARVRHEARQRVPEPKPVDDSLHAVIAVLAKLLTDHDTANDVKRRTAA